jgi:hypothetical protein
MSHADDRHVAVTPPTAQPARAGRPRLTMVGGLAPQAPLAPMPPPPVVHQTTSALTWRNQLDHCAARWGYRRGAHRVPPGLYALGAPDGHSPVLVTANYTLSFDAVRAALAGRNAYILVLDTQGINVWCAAGKGTFGNAELVRRIGATRLEEVTPNRTLILPQLGAPGISAHELRRLSGFRVEYGPVRADDLGAYLDSGVATPEMRRVRFALRDRVVLIPVELVGNAKWFALGIALMYTLGGAFAALGALLAVLAGTVLFPLLLPWLPFRAFSAKGLAIGAVAAVWPAVATAQSAWVVGGWPYWLRAIGLALGMPAVAGYLALNFTGATPLMSHTQVEREMRRYIPWLAGLAGLGAISLLVAGIAHWIGGGRWTW